MQWSDEYNVGVSFMDEDHQHGADLITQMQGKSGADLADVLRAFIAHCDVHFAREEEMMEKTQFFAYVPHKGEHTKTLDELRAALAHIESDMTDLTGDELSKRLEDWLINHRNTMDQVTAAHAKNAGFEGEAP